MAKKFGDAFINEILYDVGKIQTVSTDTNFRVLALAWLNRTLSDIQSRQPHWRFLETSATFPTVASQMSYDLPTDIDGYKIFDLRQKDSDVKLTYIDQRRFDELEPDPTTSTGNPYVYTIFADSLRLWSVPSSIITMYIRYMKNIDKLTDSGASDTDIPERFEQVVLDGAKIHAYRYEEGWGDVNSQVALYEAGIQKMITDNSHTNDDDGVSERHGDRVMVYPRFNPQGSFA